MSEPQARPSRKILAIQTAAALAVATAFTVLIALPAERGLDLTGFGRLVGLTRMAEPAAARPGPAAVNLAPAGVHNASPTAFRDDVLEIRLQPGGLEGSEIERKVWMETGQTFVYAWTADQDVYADFHGETLDRPQPKVVTYRITDPDQGANPRAANGGFTAPMTGFHGWYFLNLSEAPVTIRVKLAGFYDTRPYEAPH